MASATPRKRKRSSDGLLLVYGNPVKKLMMEFTEEPPMAMISAGQSSASPVKQMPSVRDDDKENHHMLQKSKKLQKLDTSPLQRASVPKGIQREFPQRMSPECGTTHSSIVSTSSFYSKGKQYRSLLERKLANESHPLGPRNDGNLLIASKSETAHLKVMTASTISKCPGASRQAKNLPGNTKRAKIKMAPPKGKEDANCAMEKKMDGPFRVLSMKFKPVVKLQTGAAFFGTGKWQPGSKKMLPSSPYSVSKSIGKGNQDNPLTHSKLCLSTQSKATEEGRKGSCANGLSKEEKRDRLQDDVKLIHNTSQNKESICELNLLQNTRLLKTPHSGCTKAHAEKETDAGIQDCEENFQRSLRNMGKHESASSMPSLADDTHLLFSTLIWLPSVWQRNY
ncbi:uncharacterized protein LOC133371844 [Rhineura floridana]|uniref:uncharacterized protein LOC133371844 n=1 Tax=Rhineura floridana TaxID=261503 RepID=UPI002AC7F109|nr:uncharacterized protein LOC133371844 [Rhineura floridana]